jgi:predicted Zn-dependent protease
LLRPANRFALGNVAGFWLTYIYGQAYLKQQSGKEAAVEFQRILDHRGTDVMSPLYPLAHLGLARAAVLSGDTTQARKSYQDFLAVWKDADAELPILQQAKSEYEKLK